MPKMLRWGIVGCGDVVEKKSGPSILQAGGSRIVGVMRRQAAKARPFAEANGIELCTDDATRIIEHPDVDIVYVATPPSSHKEYVLAAAAAGKHVLVEKPMGMGADEDAEMIAACDAAGVELFVAYYRRFHPHVLKMKELLAEGRIGTPVHGQIDFAIAHMPDYNWGWRVKKEISGGGLFVDVVTHRIDVMICLLGEPVFACGTKSTLDPDSAVEDVATLAVGFASGAQCSVVGDFHSERSSDRFVLTGGEGTIHTDRLDGHAFSLTTGDTCQEFAFEPLAAPHLGLVQHIERVLAGGEANGCSGRDGRLTDLILDWGLRSGCC
jgi:predicted dehydrogenase